jgi:hypothetical protein
MTQSVLIVFPINTGFKRWKERTLLTKCAKDKKNSQPLLSFGFMRCFSDELSQLPFSQQLSENILEK